MSEMKHILEISPDRYGTRTETRYASGFNCPRCSGQGSFWDTTGHNQPTFTTCNHCDGTGKIRAIISVEWEADYES